MTIDEFLKREIRLLKQFTLCHSEHDEKEYEYARFVELFTQFKNWHKY